MVHTLSQKPWGIPWGPSILHYKPPSTTHARIVPHIGGFVKMGNVEKQGEWMSS